jgi:hypothetical protein
MKQVIIVHENGGQLIPWSAMQVFIFSSLLCFSTEQCENLLIWGGVLIHK